MSGLLVFGGFNICVAPEALMAGAATPRAVVSAPVAYQSMHASQAVAPETVVGRATNRRQK